MPAMEEVNGCKRILLTGASGFIGYHVLLNALDVGYTVVAAVRSLVKQELLLNSTQLKRRQVGGRLSFIIVPDLTLPGAYDEAMKGVQYVIHVASPLPQTNLTSAQFQELLIEPAVSGTIEVLRSAQMEPSVKRVVITSSVSALAPDTVNYGPVSTVFSAKSRLPTPLMSTVSNGRDAYIASKIAALNAAEGWIRTERPAFEVTHLHPSCVLGRDELHSGNMTNDIVLNVALGKKSVLPTFASITVHVDDVAKVHVAALDKNVPSNTSYILSSNNPVGSHDGSNFGDTADLVLKHFESAVRDGILPNNGIELGVPVKLDVRKTEETFGFTHRSFEDQVFDVVSHYLETKIGPTEDNLY